MRLPSFILLLVSLLSNGNGLAINVPSDKPAGQFPRTIVSQKDGLSRSFIFPHVTTSSSSVAADDDDTPCRNYEVIPPIISTNNNQGIKMHLPSIASIAKLQSIIRSTFLPSGYPAKIPNGYLPYCIWSWIQDLSTQLRSVLATQRVLEGVGVGREGATALSASLNFIVRDGCGMASTLLFTAVTSSWFRCDVKRWRLFADCINGE